MKGLVFNLLERLARNAGCSDAVWGLVADFAATDAQLSGLAGTRRPSRGPNSGPFTLSAEALIRCFAATEGIEDDELPGLEFEPDGDWAAGMDEGLDDDLRDEDDDLDDDDVQSGLLEARRAAAKRDAFPRIDWARADRLVNEDDD